MHHWDSLCLGRFLDAPASGTLTLTLIVFPKGLTSPAALVATIRQPATGTQALFYLLRLELFQEWDVLNLLTRCSARSIWRQRQFQVPGDGFRIPGRRGRAFRRGADRDLANREWKKNGYGLMETRAGGLRVEAWTSWPPHSRPPSRSSRRPGPPPPDDLPPNAEE